jgi:tetratricopeptide (TPR) repeat protein
MRMIGIAMTLLIGMRMMPSAEVPLPAEESLRRAAQEIKLNNFNAAEQVLREVLGKNPRSFIAHNLMGLVRLNEGKAAEARQAFEQATRINPGYAPAHVNLGNTLVMLKQENAALKEFLTAITLQPKDSLALYNIGLIYGRQGKFELAAKYLNRAHVVAPEDRGIMLALAGARISCGMKQGAEALISKLAKQSPLSSQARESLAVLWLENGEPTKGAGLVKDDAESASQFYELGLQKAKRLFDSGAYAESARLLETIRDLRSPSAEFHNLLGSAYYLLDDPKKASDELQEAVRLEPLIPEHYFKLGMVFLKHRTTEPAIYVFENALKARPDVPKLWMGLGLSYYLASKLDQAEKALRQAIALDRKYETAYIVLGDLLSQAGKLDEAEKVFRSAIDARPDLYLPYYYYGQTSARQGKENLETVIHTLQKAIALNPSFPEAHYELGKALLQSGRLGEALKALKRSVELKPGLAQSHYQLGQLYQKLGNPALASEHFRLFETASKQETPEDLIQRLDVQIEKQ